MTCTSSQLHIRWTAFFCHAILVALLTYPIPSHAQVPAESQIDYQRDIRPLLSDHCYDCHGPDEKARKGKLRLDRPENVLIDLGGHVIVPGSPQDSPLIQRITNDDPSQRMPPTEADQPLNNHQIQLLTEWIRQGSHWDEHWAYQPPQRPSIPVINSSFVRNPIDRFTLSRLENEHLDPSSPAESVTLIRRLSFDLTGLPPTPEEVRLFIEDPSSDAYEKQVDRLLKSPHYGERMAMYWFDLVRYANTIGIHADNIWDITPYRNWVIQSLNSNMGYDQFTRNQIAGDLLPNATLSQKIASSYNRLNLITREGGSQAKEFLAKYAADRVRNCSSVWLATTLGCAECHDHKYDPISTKEFYQFSAFFSDIQQVGVYGKDFPPYLQVPSPQQDRDRNHLVKKVKELQSHIDTPTAELDLDQVLWEQSLAPILAAEPEIGPWYSIGPFQADSFDEAHDRSFGPEKKLDLHATYGSSLKWKEHPEWKDGQIHDLTGDHSATYLYRLIRMKVKTSVSLSLGSDDSIRVFLNDTEVLENKTTRTLAPNQETLPVVLKEGENHLLIKICNQTGNYGFYFHPLQLHIPENIKPILPLSPPERSSEQQKTLQAYHHSVTPLLQKPREQLALFEKRLTDLDGMIPKIIATVATTPQITRVLPRGNWMDDSGEIVMPAVPSSMGRLPETDDHQTRLELADWLVSRSNPLTARVFVNRLWMLFFGRGLSNSVDDFGIRGESPTHPDLLDWLAVEFMDSDWNIKHLIRLIVTSGTYRQSSLPREDFQVTDPFNQLLARQSRFRFSAETVRDNALAIAGLLNRQVAGSAVSRPYQPKGYYRHLNFPKREYRSDQNNQQYRRGIYIHWQRQYIHPAMKAFDAPSREECVAQRPRSNTPLAALVLMNDPTFVEAARFFAQQLLGQSELDATALIQRAFQIALSRDPQEREIQVLLDLLHDQKELFQKDRSQAIAFLQVGLQPVPDNIDPVELASWTMVTRTLLNLHETITRY